MAVHEELFQRLQSAAEIHALVGQSEDLHLDCKVWPQKDEDAQRILAKALCGFANGDGGVVVIGMEARAAPSKYDPDLVQRALPVTDPTAVRSRIEALVGDLVEPRLEGVRTTAISDPLDLRRDSLSYRCHRLMGRLAARASTEIFTNESRRGRTRWSIFR